MGHKTIRHTITRNGIYYVRFRLPGNRYFRKSLETDSHAQEHLLMSFASPVIPLVQSGNINPGLFADRLSEFSCHLKQQNENWLMQQFLNDDFSKHQPLAGAWNMYKKEKAQNWTKTISQANERFMAVLFIVLGSSTDVTTFNKQDIKQVMEVVENLPKCVVQPYRSMTVQQLIECDEVPPDDLVGAE